MKEKIPQPNKRLKHERDLQGWSQQILAEKLNTTEHAISRWERGSHKPNRHFQTQLCTLFGKNAVELGFLDEWEGEEQKKDNLDEKKDQMAQRPEGAKQRVPLLYQLEAREMPRDLEMGKPSLPYSPQRIMGEGSEEQKRLDMDEGRRQLLQQTISTTSMAMITPTSLVEEFTRVLIRPSTLEKAHLAALEKHAVLFWQYRDDGILSPETLYASVARDIQPLIHLLEHPFLPSIQMRLLAITSKLFTLCGVLLYDLGRNQQAREHYKTAIQAAAQAEQPVLQAIASTWMSFTWTYEQRYQEAAHQVTQSLSLLTGAHADRGTFAWTAAVAAEISAQLGTYDGSRSYLDQAEQLLPEQSHEQPYLSFHHFDKTQLHGFQGVCYQLFYDPQNFETVKLLEQARTVLEKAVLDETVPFRQNHLYRVDLANVYTKQGEIEMACDLAIRAIQDTSQGTAKNVWKRLEELQQQLHPWKETPAVKSLHEALRTRRSET